VCMKRNRLVILGGVGIIHSQPLLVAKDAFLQPFVTKNNLLLLTHLPDSLRFRDFEPEVLNFIPIPAPYYNFRG
jgi:hypothetical protein